MHYVKDIYLWLLNQPQIVKEEFQLKTMAIWILPGPVCYQSIQSNKASQNHLQPKLLFHALNLSKYCVQFKCCMFLSSW